MSSKHALSDRGLGARLVLLIAMMLVALAGCEAKKDDAGEEKANAESAEGEGEGEGEAAEGESGETDEADPAKAEGEGDAAAEAEAEGAEAEGTADDAATDDGATDDAGTADDAAADAAAAQAAAAVTDTVGANAAAAAAAATNPFVKGIPGDTLYAFATVTTMTMDEMPFDITDFLGMYDSLAEAMAQDGESKMFAEILAEVSARLKADGIAGLGIKDGGHFALYGVGVFPVMKLELGDAAKFESLLEAIASKAGVEPEIKEAHGVSYRTLVVEDQASFAVAIQDGTLTITVATPETLDWVLEYALGAKAPATSLADGTRISALASRAPATAKAITVGFFDVQGAVGVLAGDVKGMAAESLTAMGAPLPLFDGVCKTEFMTIAKAVPQVAYSGYYDEDNDVVAAVTLNITDTTLTTELKKLPGSAPGLDTTPENAAFFVGLGVNVKAGIDFITGQSARIQASPWECKDLGFINDVADDLAGLGKPNSVPPFLMDLTGAYVMLESFKLTDAGPSDIKAMASIGHAKPAELWMAAAAISPELGKVKLGTEPAKLPVLPGLEFLDQLYIVEGNGALGLAHGDAMAEQLPKFLGVTGDGQAPLLVYGYDYGRIAQMFPPEVLAAPGMSELMSGLGGLGLSKIGLYAVDTGLEFRLEQRIPDKK